MALNSWMSGVTDNIVEGALRLWPFLGHDSTWEKRQKILLRVPFLCWINERGTELLQILFAAHPSLALIVFTAIHGTCLIPSHPSWTRLPQTGHTVPGPAPTTLSKGHHAFPWSAPAFALLCAGSPEIAAARKEEGSSQGAWKPGLGFQLYSLHGAEQWKMNHYSLTIYLLTFLECNTEQSWS